MVRRYLEFVSESWFLKKKLCEVSEKKSSISKGLYWNYQICDLSIKYPGSNHNFNHHPHDAKFSKKFKLYKRNCNVVGVVQ